MFRRISYICMFSAVFLSWGILLSLAWSADEAGARGLSTEVRPIPDSAAASASYESRMEGISFLANKNVTPAAAIASSTASSTAEAATVKKIK